MKDRYDTIEAYLQGSLSAQEKLSFEKRLKEDDVFLEEYEYHLLMKDVLIENRIKHVEDLLGEKKTKGFRKKYVIGVLLLAFVSTAFWGYVYTHQQSDTDTIKETKPASETLSANDSKVASMQLEKPVASVENKKREQPEKVVVERQQQQQQPEELSSLPVSSDTRLSESLQEDTVAEQQVKVVDTISKDQHDKIEVLDVSAVSTETAGPQDNMVDDSSHVTTSEPDPINIQRVHLEIAPLEQAYDEFPFVNSESGILYIYSKNGSLVRKLEILDGEPSYWNGTNTNGNILAGYYLFKFESENTQLMGGITVIY